MFEEGAGTCIIGYTLFGLVPYTTLICFPSIEAIWGFAGNSPLPGM